MKKKSKSEMTISQKITELSAAKQKKSKSKTSFIQELKDEMKKVSWTSKEELRVCVKIVIGAIFALGLGIYLIDVFIRLILDGLGNLSRLIGA